MIGLVISRPAVAKVADVTPLSLGYVWWVKTSMIFNVLPPVMKFLFTAHVVALEVVVATAIYWQTMALVPACLICAWNLYAVIRDTWIKPASYASQWRIAPLSFYDPAYIYVSSPLSPLPPAGQAIAERVRALGLVPYVNYLDDDPFLFVLVGGKRVYLYHW